MIRVQIDKNSAWVTQREKITMYSEGYDAVQIELSLSDEWSGLSKIAVFRAGDVQIDVAVSGNTVTVPANVILVPNVHLFFGLYGLATANGRVAIPTTWADLGIIQPAADPTAAQNYGQPVPDLYAQLAAKVTAAEAAAEEANSGHYAGTATWSIPTSGEKTGHLLMTIDGSDPVDLGICTAYGEALAANYEGSEAEFRAMLIANYVTSETLEEIEALAESAASTAESAASDASDAVTAATEATAAATEASAAVSGKQAQHKTATVTLTSGASSWSNVSATGVTASNLVIWSPAPASFLEAQDKQVRMTAQGAGVVTFAAESNTTADITINLAIFD